MRPSRISSQPSWRAAKTISGVESRPVIRVSGKRSSSRCVVSAVPKPSSSTRAGANGIASIVRSCSSS